MGKKPVKVKPLTAAELQLYNRGVKAGITSQDTIIKKAVTEAYNSGIQKGTDDGKKEGHKKGYESGQMAGEKLGYSRGFTVGEEKFYPEGYENGKSDNRRLFVATIETKMAEADGYTDALKWRAECKMPTWWIACLMALWDPVYKHPAEKSEPNIMANDESNAGGKLAE